MTPGAALRSLRETRPMIHQITNYVVMNETANATLAVGGQPVMAHALEEVEEMVAFAGALVLNIGTLSPTWVEAMLLAGAAANRIGIPVVLDPVGAGATRYRTRTAERILNEVDVAIVRGNAGEVATLAGIEAEVRGVDSVGVGSGREEVALGAARKLGLTVSVSGPVDHASDGERVVSVSNGDPLMGAVTGTGCMLSAVTGCFAAVCPDDPLAAYGVAGEDAAASARGPGSFHMGLYDALYLLDPDTLDARARIA
jgi:hydroxyethylthiazole kinase